MSALDLKVARRLTAVIPLVDGSRRRGDSSGIGIRVRLRVTRSRKVKGVDAVVGQRSVGIRGDRDDIVQWWSRDRLSRCRAQPGYGRGSVIAVDIIAFGSI